MNFVIKVLTGFIVLIMFLIMLYMISFISIGLFDLVYSGEISVLSYIIIALTIAIGVKIFHTIGSYILRNK